MTKLDLAGIDPLPSGNFRLRLQYRGEVISGTAPTAELAAQMRDELKRQIIDGELAPTKGSTTKALGPRFLASRSGNRDTYNDVNRWHRHIATASWARLEPKAVTRADGAAWLKSLKAKHAPSKPNKDPKRRGGKRVERLSVSTRKHCLVLARRFFEWALLQPMLGIAANPFAGLTVEREDGDEDQGYQDTWYLDAMEQRRFLSTWDDPSIDFDANERAEKWIAAVALGTMMREREQWCLHLGDVHVAKDEVNPRIEVRFGTYDPIKKRFRPPKGRKGKKRVRTVHLHGARSRGDAHLAHDLAELRGGEPARSRLSDEARMSSREAPANMEARRRRVWHRAPDRPDDLVASTPPHRRKLTHLRVVGHALVDRGRVESARSHRHPHDADLRAPSTAGHR